MALLNQAAWAYQRQPDGKDEWLTPPELINALGQFDLDPCAPVIRPWPTARRHFTVEDDGLTQPLTGRVWCNPPYDRRVIGQWVERAVAHRNVTLLVFARTETRFFRLCFTHATLIAFMAGSVSATSTVNPDIGQAAPGPPSSRSIKPTPRPFATATRQERSRHT